MNHPDLNRRGPKLKDIFNAAKIILFLSFLFIVASTAQLKAQTVTDPAKNDPGYAIRKAALPRAAPAPAARRTQRVNSFSNSPRVTATNECFIPVDETFTPVPKNDDGSLGPISIPFTFSLYGTIYDQLWINTNGNITFDGALATYNPEGFPINTPMIAPFWADVDTRDSNVDGGLITYKINPTSIIITWTNVGYYAFNTDKRNTFQLVITNGQDPVIGIGNNVAFFYDDMQWTTGAVSGGSMGFGGYPATVGINKGNGFDYVQVGRFNQDNSSYGGPSTSDNGVNYLDAKCFRFNVGSDTTNIPPSVSGLPANNTITLSIGDTVSISPQFIGPEVGQKIITIVNKNGVCNIDTLVTNGEVSTALITIVGAECNLGSHIITLTATDDGINPKSTTVDITVIVKQKQTITFDAIPNKTYGDLPFPITATSSAGLPVSFNVVSGPATVSGNTVTLTGGGLVTIEANQPGNIQYGPAKPVTRSFTVAKAGQTITFNAIPSKIFGTADFDPGATSTSGLPVSYTSSNTAVATIVDGKIHIVKVGTSTITASQPGSSTYNAAPNKTQLLTITKANQTITFAAISPMSYGSPDFDPGAVSSAGLPITYVSSNTAVATIIDGKVHIEGLGTTTITASQRGNTNYFSATSKSQLLTVPKGDQQITFEPIGQRELGAADFAADASASSGLPLSFTSSNTAVATVTDGIIHIVGVGSATITASQPGDANFNAAAPVLQVIQVVLSHDATLANLQTSDNSYMFIYTDSQFPDDTGELNKYLQFVNNSVSTINITATTSSPYASLTINGISVASGMPSPNFPLVNGPNYFAVVVTAQDGSTNTYTYNATRMSNNANMGSISVSPGTLSPVFSAGTTNYKVAVSNATTSVIIHATTANPHAFIYLNGTYYQAGTDSAPQPLVIGDNLMVLNVTSEDGQKERKYTVTVTRQSNNSNLSGLTISKGTLSPAFAAGTISYKDTVTASSVTIKPTGTNSRAIIKVNGIAVANGTNSGSIPLAVGNNTISTVVTSEDGTKVRTYTIAVHRIYINTDLANLTLSSGTLAPVFSAGTTSYSAAVTNATTSITLTPTTSDPAATVKVNGISVTSGSASASIPLVNGANTISVVVTGNDGVTTNTYTVTVTRLSNNSNLANLAVTPGTLTPMFAAGTLNYSVLLSSTTQSVTVTPTAANPNATITVAGVTVASGTSSASIPIVLGPNNIGVEVTSQDGSKIRTYNITVIRQSNNANLSDLLLSAGALAPAFSSATLSYTASVSNSVSTIKLTPTAANGHASIKVNGATVISGTASASIPLSVGSNTITTAVTSEDGSKIRTYTVNVTRAAAGLVAVAPLTGRTIYIVNDRARGAEGNYIAEPLVKQAVSPNGDGRNDILLVDGIENFPDNKLKVMNRDGKAVFEMASYDNISHIFDGHAGNNGKLQPAGTYFYQLLYKAADGSQKQKTGFFILKY
jgi:gliding motility-associated-like protein